MRAPPLRFFSFSRRNLSSSWVYCWILSCSWWCDLRDVKKAIQVVSYVWHRIFPNCFLSTLFSLFSFSCWHVSSSPQFLSDWECYLFARAYLLDDCADALFQHWHAIRQTIDQEGKEYGWIHVYPYVCCVIYVLSVRLVTSQYLPHWFVFWILSTISSTLDLDTT